MELKFQHALFATGAFLIIIGLAFALLNAGGAVEGAGLLESLSYGFTSVFIALFSGVLIGVGGTLVTCGLVLGLRGNVTHVLMSFMFSVLSTLIAIAAVAKAETSTFPVLVLFFAGLAAAGAFMLSAVAFGLSGALRNYLTRKKG